MATSAGSGRGTMVGALLCWVLGPEPEEGGELEQRAEAIEEGDGDGDSGCAVMATHGVPAQEARLEKTDGRRPMSAMPWSWNAPLLIWASNMPMVEITTPAPVQYLSHGPQMMPV
jgi:hypothetical protein